MSTVNTSESTTLKSKSTGSDSHMSHFVTERSDSGMEEESFSQEAISIAEEETDEEEVVSNKRISRRKKMVLDDDDDDGNDKDNDNADHGGDEKDSDIEDALLASRESKAGSGDDEPKDLHDEHSPISSPHGNAVAEEENAATHQDSSSPLPPRFGDKDVFDAESSDEDEHAPIQDNDDGVDQDEEDDGQEGSDQQNSDNDEGFDEDQLDPELLKQLKKLKGASKSAKEREKYSRKAKPIADQMLELHSESQKLTRGSRVNLPYYEPEEKTLDDFLARASKKKQEYSALRRATDFQKAQIIQDKLSVAPPRLTPTRKASHKATAASPDNKHSVSNVSTDKLPDSGLSSQDIALSQTLSISQSSTLVLQSSQEAKDTDSGGNDSIHDEKNENADDDDYDELPDLHIENVCASASADNGVDYEKDKTAVKPISECVTADNAPGESIIDSVSQKLKSTLDAELIKEVDSNGDPHDKNCLSVPSLQKDPSRDLFSSQGLSDHGSQNKRVNATSELSVESVSSSLVSAIHETPLSTQQSQLTTVSVSSSTTCAASQADMLISSSLQTESQVTALPEGNSVPIFEEKISPLIPPAGHSGRNFDEKVSSEVSETVTDPKDITHPPEQVPSATPADKKNSILQKLQQQGLVIPDQPKLTGTPKDLIFLDEPDSQAVTPQNSGLLKLMSRLAQHSQRRAPKPAYDVDISIIEKEGSEGEQQQLKLKSVKYHVQPEEELLPSDGSPGSKLSKLKQQLSVGMRKKREEARQRRIQLYNMDNEEGFERAEAAEEDEEEEAEMTDDEDNSSDEDEDEEEFALEDYNADVDDDGKDYNPLLDTEAQDDDDDSDDAGNSASDFNEDSNDFHLNFEVSDEEKNSDGDSENEVEEIKESSVKKKKRRTAAVVSDEEEDEKESAFETEIQEERKGYDEDQGSESLWSNELTPLSKHLEDTQPQGQTKFRRQSSCSPDLYATGSVEEEEEEDVMSTGLNSNNDSQSQSFFNLQSQMLDADGYLKMTQTQKPYKSRIAMLAQSSSEEIGSSMSIEQIFGGASSQVKGVGKEESENMQELMGLCSGKFSDKVDDDSLPSSQTRLKSTQSFEANDLFQESDDDVYDPFNVLSQDENAQDFAPMKKKPVLDDSDEDEDKENKENDTDVENDSEDEYGEELEKEDKETAAKFTGFKDKKRGFKREFLEEEAELSGSEFDSDENLDLAEEDDILEEELGDQDMAGISERKLRDQVGRLHMKQLQDEDDREIMRYKEMYLQDGDLYSDGRGRMRNFRWKDIDSSSQQDLFKNESEEEEVEEDPEEIQWRKDRHERNKFLEESENNGENGNSQLVKLGQGFLQKKDSFSLPSQELVTLSKDQKGSQNQKKFKLPTKGSFLKRPKDALIRIAKMAKAAIGGNVKNGRGFVFQAVEDKDKEKETREQGNTMVNSLQPPKRKAHTPSKEHVAKRQKLNSAHQAVPEKPNLKRKSSILHHLD